MQRLVPREHRVGGAQQPVEELVDAGAGARRRLKVAHPVALGDRLGAGWVDHRHRQIALVADEHLERLCRRGRQQVLLDRVKRGDVAHVVHEEKTPGVAEGLKDLAPRALDQLQHRRRVVQDEPDRLAVDVGHLSALVVGALRRQLASSEITVDKAPKQAGLADRAAHEDGLDRRRLVRGARRVHGAAHNCQQRGGAGSLLRSCERSRSGRRSCERDLRRAPCLPADEGTDALATRWAVRIRRPPVRAVRAPTC